MNQELLKALEQEAHQFITTGLSDEESIHVEQLFVDLLRSILEPIYLTPIQQKDTIARRTGEDLIQRAVSVPPKDRMEYLTNEKINQDVHRLDAQAFSLARQLLTNSIQRKTLIPQAKSILAEVIQTKGQVERIWPHQKERFNRIISETILDCQYVMSPTDKTSFRVGRLIKVRKRDSKKHPSAS